MYDEAALRENLKRLIVETLYLEDVEPASIGDDQELFGSGLSLDSIDALELMVAVEKEYDLKLKAHEVDKNAFRSVSTLAHMLSGELERAKTSAS